MWIYFRTSFVVLILLGTLLFGFRQYFQDSRLATLPINENMPDAWTPLGDVQLVNIDGDEPMEYLLYFTYNGSNGPVGAVIYNTETDEGPVSDDTASGQVLTSYIPYAILPSYRFGTGQGFIAEKKSSSNITIRTYFATYQDEWTISTNSEGTADALAITDGNSYLTWVWWQPELNHYGVYQIHATGRFETPERKAFAWGSWRTTPDPLNDIIVTHPRHDRNQFCNRKRYVLALPEPGFPMQIVYNEYDLGLSFCYGAPENAFYPEGVVLAYLLEGDINYWDLANLDAATLQELIDQTGQSQLIRVDDMASYRAAYSTIEFPDPLEIRVCAELIMAGDYVGPRVQPVRREDVLPSAALGTHVGSASTTNFQRRWLLFTLRHEPPHREPAIPDRFYITNVEPLPVSPPKGKVDCKSRLEWQLTAE